MQYVPIALAPPKGEGGEGVPGCAPQGKGGLGGMLPFMIIMFAIFYFLLIRPQQRRQKEHQKMVSEIQKGDKVVTAGGVHGVVSNVKETTVMVKVAENVKLEVSRGSISKVAKRSDGDQAKE